VPMSVAYEDLDQPGRGLIQLTRTPLRGEQKRRPCVLKSRNDSRSVRSRVGTDVATCRHDIREPPKILV
jgi:hypothetical protein